MVCLQAQRAQSAPSPISCYVSNVTCLCFVGRVTFGRHALAKSIANETSSQITRGAPSMHWYEGNSSDSLLVEPILDSLLPIHWVLVDCFVVWKSILFSQRHMQ